MTSSNRYISALLALCVGSPPVTSGFPFQRSATRSFGIFFDLRLNKWLSKQLRFPWFETPWRSLWRKKWITQFLYRNHELVTNVRTFAQILMIGEFYGLCQSVIEFADYRPKQLEYITCRPIHVYTRSFTNTCARATREWLDIWWKIRCHAICVTSDHGANIYFYVWSLPKRFSVNFEVSLWLFNSTINLEQKLLHNT